MGRIATVVAVALGSCAAPLHRADALQVVPREHSFIGTSVEVEAEPRRGWVQRQLDTYCQDFFDLKCPSVKAVCTKAVARLETGGTQQPQRLWRCYAESVISTSEATADCVNDCGAAVPCGDGLAKGKTPVYMSYNDEILKFIASKKLECNAEGIPTMTRLQRILDDFCSSVFRGACTQNPQMCGALGLARKDAGTRNQRSKDWRCYESSLITKSVNTALCVTDCGQEVQCGDGVKGGESTNHLSFAKELPQLIRYGKKELCPDGAMLAPALEVFEKERLFFGGSVQLALNGKCMSLFAEACALNQDGICGGAVARMALRGKEFRCYAISNIEDGEQGSYCLDDCGRTIPCHGEPAGDGMPLPDFDRLVEQASRLGCPATQKAAQKACDSVGEGKLDTVARKSSAGWQCLNVKEVDYELTGACFDGCGGETKCPGSMMRGASNTTAVPALEQAAKEVFVCQSEAVCSATPPRATRCVIGKELTPGYMRTVTIKNLHQDISLWFGDCLMVRVEPDESSHTASVAIKENGKEGGFFTQHHNGTYVITIKAAGEDLAAIVTHSEKQDEGNYTVKRGWECASKGPVEYSAVSSDVIVKVEEGAE